MEGFVTDYTSMFAAELGKPSIYEEYAQFMTGTPRADAGPVRDRPRVRDL
jgi:hypothetical protein